MWGRRGTGQASEAEYRAEGGAGWRLPLGEDEANSGDPGPGVVPGRRASPVGDFSQKQQAETAAGRTGSAAASSSLRPQCRQRSPGGRGGAVGRPGPMWPARGHARPACPPVTNRTLHSAVTAGCIFPARSLPSAAWILRPDLEGAALALPGGHPGVGASRGPAQEEGGRTRGKRSPTPAPAAGRRPHVGPSCSHGAQKESAAGVACSHAAPSDRRRAHHSSDASRGHPSRRNGEGSV